MSSRKNPSNRERTRALGRRLMQNQKEVQNYRHFGSLGSKIDVGCRFKRMSCIESVEEASYSGVAHGAWSSFEPQEASDSE